ARTDATGVAASPRFAANDVAGKLTATATTTGTTDAATFALRNTAAQATTITPGVAAAESTSVGTTFAVRLAVTVTDENDNPVPGVRVTFSAPTHGPTARFGRRRTTAVVTNRDGVAVAASLTAGPPAGLLAEIDRLGTNLLTVTNGQTFFGDTAELPLAAPGMVARIGPVLRVADTGSTSANVYRSPLIPKVNTNGLTVQAATLELLPV